ncbi:MAG: lamin tail domain-containing protein [candidate division Zixibacteria bacterium]|nr:lamin tail domain-containing protein [candidate division Zixibacteria bacterium]
MKKLNILLFILLLLSLTACAYAQGDVVLNEVLANEPKSWTSLEWVELFNGSDEDINLAGWKLINDEDTTVFDSIVITAGEYLVLARRLISTTDSISFEGHWGDNSGVWGDSPNENFPAVQVKISLTNSCDSVELIDTSGNTCKFIWINDSGDGISWEKINPQLGDSANNWWVCIDSSGSTPGRKNSVNVTYSDAIKLELEPKVFSPDGDGFEDELKIKYTLPLMSNLTLKVYDTKGRLVKILLEDEPRISGEIIWDGRDNNNRFLKIGMYILYAYASGNTNSKAKVTFAVAKK